ncbi:MAG TPA: RCC1 domain-containing protein, partial [Anaerolineales bacterium]
MFTHFWKYVKLVFLILAILLMLTGVLGVTPGQVVAAPYPEGVKPPLPEQAASVLVESLSAGGLHTCVVKSDGTLACWGAGTTNTGVIPVYGQSIPPGGTFTQVSAGLVHTCGLRSDGSLACWGAGTT